MGVRLRALWAGKAAKQECNQKYWSCLF